MVAARSLERRRPAVFDRAHLEHYTMHDQQLAAEVLRLYLAQLPATLQLLEEAETAEAWRFAAHALKGSSAAVGAQKLHELAVRLEAAGFPPERRLRLLKLKAIEGAVAQFRAEIAGSYPAAAAS